MKDEFKIFKQIASKSVGFWVAMIGILGGTAVHTFVLITKLRFLSGLGVYFQAFMVAIVLDAAIMYFSVKNVKWVTKTFLVFTILNMFMSYLPAELFDSWLQYVVAALISTQMGLAVYAFSEQQTFEEPKPTKRDKAKALREKGHTWREIGEELEMNYQKIYNDLKEWDKKRAQSK